MRITALDVFPVDIPLREPIFMSNVELHASSNVLVRLTTDGGVVGWGEAVEAPYMTGDTQRHLIAGVLALRATVLGADPMDRAGLWRRMAHDLHGNAAARSAIDIAVHDLVGRALGMSVSTLLGGTPGATIPLMTLFGHGDPDGDLETFRARAAAGFRLFKLKLGMGPVDAEIETVRRVSAELDGAVLSGDANGGWDLSTANRFLRGVADLPMRFVEQPVMERDALVRLAATSPIALCADETAASLAAIAGYGPTSVAGVSLKLIKLGGITGLMRGAATCGASDLAMNLAGKTVESSVSAAANLHCAAAIGELAFGCSPGNQQVDEDVVTDPIRVESGSMRVPTGPGLGVDVDLERVRAMATPGVSV
jgi:muconate cycloisomerase